MKSRGRSANTPAGILLVALVISPQAMPPDLHQRLKELDNSDEWETPYGFDYFRALGEVVHHRPTIEYLLRTKLSLDHQVQDASHFCELDNWDRSQLNPDGGGMLVPIIAIRFSAFDRMFTVFGRDLEHFADRLPSLIDHMTKHRYKYVAYADLATPYDGTAKPGTEHWTWFTRFFDYL